jgi:octaprenyl-diphosphate synthase
MRKFGELIGMAFQIKDDLLIIQKMPLVPTGIDIKEQKMTLPLIHFEYVYFKEKTWLINSIKTIIKIKKRIKEVIAFVKTITDCYMQNKMVQFQQEALVLLDNYTDWSLKTR